MLIVDNWITTIHKTKDPQSRGSEALGNRTQELARPQKIPRNLSFSWNGSEEIEAERKRNEKIN